MVQWHIPHEAIRRQGGSDKVRLSVQQPYGSGFGAAKGPHALPCVKEMSCRQHCAKKHESSPRVSSLYEPESRDLSMYIWLSKDCEVCVQCHSSFKLCIGSCFATGACELCVLLMLIALAWLQCLRLFS